MKKLQSLGESVLLFGILFLVYEIMDFAYIFIVRRGITNSWWWVDVTGYSPLNLDETSLYYVKDHPVEYTIISWLVIILVIVLTALVSRGQLLSSMSFRWLTVNNFLNSVTVGFGLVFVLNGVIAFAVEVTGDNLVYIPQNMFSTYELTFLVVTVGIAVPVFEELFFRGLIMGRLAMAFSRPTAVVLAAVVFAASHLNLSQSGFVLPVGLLCGLLVLRSGSVFSGIWLHITYNVVNIYLAKMDFFQYNSLQLLIMIVFGTGLMYFGFLQVHPPAEKKDGQVRAKD